MLTLIIPVKDRRELLAATLRSVSAQRDVTPDEVEIIVVDNGSDAHTLLLLEQWIASENKNELKVKLLHENHGGVCAARNRGLYAARSEWVMFFDSDDIMAPDHLRGVLDAIAAHETSADVIYWDIAFVTSTGRHGKYRARGVGDIWSDVIIRGVLSTQRYCCRRRVLMEVGGWDDRAEVWNDWELSLRLLTSGVPMVYHNSATTVTALCHDDSITCLRFSMQEGKREMTMEIARDRALSAGLPRVADLIDMKGAVLAGDYAREHRADLARELLTRIEEHSSVSAWKLWLIAFIERYIGRGASLVIWLLEKI